MVFYGILKIQFLTFDKRARHIFDQDAEAYRRQNSCFVSVHKSFRILMGKKSGHMMVVLCVTSIVSHSIQFLYNQNVTSTEP